MQPAPSQMPGTDNGPAFARRFRLVVVLAGLLAGPLVILGRAEPPAAGQLPAPAMAPVQILPPTCPPDCPPDQPKPPLPPAPQKAPRPLTGPDSVGSFLDTISSNDTAFEVIVGQGRILTLKESLGVKGKAAPLIAVGDPSVAEFAVVNARQVRVTGLRLGVTDLSITTSDGQVYSFEVRVVADLDVLRAKLRCVFPTASLKLGALRDHVIVEGQARDAAQVTQILDTIRAYLASVQVGQLRQIRATQAARPSDRPPAAVRPGDADAPPEALVGPERAPSLQVQGTVATPQIINLLRVPGPQQVLLKVRVAELNRSGLRAIGADFLAVDPESGLIAGTQIGGATISAIGTIQGFTQRGGIPSTLPGTETTAFGIFQPGDFQVFLRALRRNNLLKILAEPNLVAMSGHQANFLAGGEFPIPVPQVGASGVAPTITVTFKQFGVQLGFVPYILDGDVIRLSVDPEVSQLDFAIATTLVAGGSPVPGLSTRKAHTTVELRQGQTLAIAGLLQLTMDGTTSRIPMLGDLPILGPFFSNTTGSRVEKELVVLVTPYLIEPMNAGQVPPTPGDEVKGPNDLEFYLLGRLEGKTGYDFRATTEYDTLRCLFKLHKDNVCGPHGFSE
ncbi:MAG: pilus assembly protein N-terminal domain-containing protein [Gemmataceae bacterium]